MVVQNMESAMSKLIDDADFSRIHNVLGRFNLFEAIGGVRTELRHSNFLAYLLSPDRSHGLGDRALKVLLREMINQAPDGQRPVPALAVALRDLDDAVVHRESDYIDIIVEIKELGLVLVIENKVGAKA